MIEMTLSSRHRRSEAEHATSRSRRLPPMLAFTRGWGRNIFVSFKPSRPGTEPRGPNHYPRALAQHRKVVNEM